MLESVINKVDSLQPWNFIKKRHQHRYFPVNIATFSRTSIFKEHLFWMLLKRSY